nr:isocitrate lyase/phosphoenolpyruvate mutase family protein [Sphingomonas sp. Y57]
MPCPQRREDDSDTELPFWWNDGSRFGEHPQYLIQFINFEDRKVRGEGLYGVEEQAERLRAVVAAAAGLDRPVFINARTDLFLGTDPATHAARLDEALTRVTAYAAAGAGSFFVPGLGDPALIARICENSPLPVNVMVLDPTADLAALARLGVARISFGPAPYVAAMQSLTALAGQLLGN